ncbi:MAG: hypothetical protein ACPG6V_08220 [Flavobacteriales bacterium]
MIKSVYRFLHPRFQNVFLDYKVQFKPRETSNPNSLLYDIINQNRTDYQELLSDFLQYKDVFHQIKLNDVEQDENQPAWNNKFLPGLDIINLYGFLRK